MRAHTTTVLQCGYGVQARSLQCVLASTTESGNDTVVGDDACAGADGLTPTRQQLCTAGPCHCNTSAECTTALGPYFVCGANGTCECDAGRAGADCSALLLLPIGANCSSTAVVDVNGTCCDGDSAIDTVTGTCCGGGVAVDGNGRCCAAGETVDACGVCGGNGTVVDILGQCCASPLAPSGLCCDGWLDSCGVCGGTNNCDVEVTFSVPADANSSSVASAIGVPSSVIVNFTVISNGSAVVSAFIVVTAPVLVFSSFYPASLHASSG